MSDQASFHEASDSVRFWVMVDGQAVGASISSRVLHHRYCPGKTGDDPMDTFRAHAQDIMAAVRARVGQGSIEPVMVREFDLRSPPDAKALT